MIWAIIMHVQTDLTLTTDRLMDVFIFVENPDWIIEYLLYMRIRIISIGMLLGLPQSAVEEIKRSYQSHTKRLDAYLDTYSHQHPCPSWKKVAKALRRCEAYQLADEVDNTYVQGTCMYVLFRFL